MGSAGEGNLVVELEEVGVATTTLTPAMVRIHHRMVFKVLKDKQALPQQMVRCLSPSKTQLLSNIQAQVTKEIPHRALNAKTTIISKPFTFATATLSPHVGFCAFYEGVGRNIFNLVLTVKISVISFFNNRLLWYCLQSVCEGRT